MATLKQRHAHAIFKGADLLADGRLGYVQFTGRLGEAAMAGGGLEGDQMVKLGEGLTKALH